MASLRAHALPCPRKESLSHFPGSLQELSAGEGVRSFFFVFVCLDWSNRRAVWDPGLKEPMIGTQGPRGDLTGGRW